MTVRLQGNPLDGAPGTEPAGLGEDGMLLALRSAQSRDRLDHYWPYIVAAVAAVTLWVVVRSQTFQAVLEEAGYVAAGTLSAPSTGTFQTIFLLATGAVATAAGPWFERWSWRQGIVVLLLWWLAAPLLSIVIHRSQGVGVDFVPAILIPTAIYVTALIVQLQSHGRSTFVKDMAITHKNALIQSVIENTHEAVFVADYEGKIIYVNRTGLEMFGLSDEETIGASVDILSPTLGQGRIGREISHYLAIARSEGKQIGPIETSGLRKDASTFSIHLTVGVARFVGSNHPYERRKGDRFLYICNVSDISARRKMIEAQRLALEHQVIANRAKSEFLANMSHELRTPLNAVIGFSEMLSGRYFGDLTEKQAGYVQFIHSSATHLLKLINDILDISKIEAGHTDLQEEVIDIREAIQACIGLVKHRAIESRISLKSSELTDVQYLHADERRFKQVLLNLLSNAVKFTPAGGDVEVVTELDQEGALVVSVVDSGVGIAPQDVATALAPFGQVDSGLNRKFEGTGLGLPLSKSLIEAHGGTLTLTSSIGVGTTVTCRFPPERTRRQATAGRREEIRPVAIAARPSATIEPLKKLVKARESVPSVRKVH